MTFFFTFRTAASRAAIFLGLTAATLIGCTSSEEGVAPGAEDQPGLTAEEAHAAAEAMLLTLEDLPEGWKQLPVDTDEDPPPPELTGDCADLNLDSSSAPGLLAESETRELASPDENVEVQFSSQVFENETLAAKTFATTRRFLGECRGQFEQAFLEAMKTELAKRQSEAEEGPLSFGPTPDLEVKGFALSEVEFTGFGDESSAMQLSSTFHMTERDFTTHIDLIGIRVGNLLTGYSYHTGTETPELGDERELAALVDERTREVAASLRGEGDPLPAVSVSFSRTDAGAAASAAVLTKDDFTGDWSSIEHDRDFTDNLLNSLSGADLPELPPECQLFLDIHFAVTDRGIAEVWSDGFLGYEIGTVDSSVTVYGNEDAARQAVQDVRALAGNCGDPIKEWWKAISAVSQAGPVEVTKYEFGEHRLGSFGDESFALRMAMVAVGPDEDDLTKDIAVVRVRNVVGLVHYTSSWGEPEPDRALEERLLGIIEGRITTAAASLD